MDTDRDRRPSRSATGAGSRDIAAAEAAKRSIRENRVYVGNLSFQVRWNDLKDFMREAGNVVFAEVMTLPNGMSKGCGVVEYSTREEAQKAIAELNEQSLLGRQLFVKIARKKLGTVLRQLAVVQVAKNMVVADAVGSADEVAVVVVLSVLSVVEDLNNPSRASN